MNIAEFTHADWMKIYFGKWCLLTTSHMADQYTKEVMFGGRPFKSQSIIFTAGGKSTGWMRSSDRDALGAYLAGKAKEDSSNLEKVCTALKKRADATLSFVDSHIGKEIDKKTYETFWESVRVYFVPHINVKYVIDYLEPALLKNVLPMLQEARLHAEPVLSRTEDFIISFAERVAERTGLRTELVLCFTKAEMSVYFDTGVIPATEVLESRSLGAVTLADKDSSAVFSGPDVAPIEEIVSPAKVSDILRGTIAYEGKVTGKVRIVYNPALVTFEEGEILVAGSTRPEYLSLMKKAAAFVTDAGGLLSHAAITARELKKPCIVGTQLATKILKDGDTVEVDADSGVVKIIKRA